MTALLMTYPLPTAAFAAAVRAEAPDLDLLQFKPDMDDAALAEVDAVLAWQFAPGMAARLPRLRWLCSVGAGAEKLLVPDLPEAVTVSRIVDTEQGDGIAQFVVMMALRHVRDLPWYEAQHRRREWTRRPVGAVRARVGVLGRGAIGGAVARLLEQVGFEVQTFSRSAGGSLQQVLADSDIVVCALPLTADTHGLLNAQRFAQMKRGSYLINIARGAHVVEADLIAAVRSGHLSGAALDVQCREPLPPDDPLWSVDGITITPHIAAQSSPQTIARQFVQGLRALRGGEAPANQVDRQRGY